MTRLSFGCGIFLSLLVSLSLTLHIAAWTASSFLRVAIPTHLPAQPHLTSRLDFSPSLSPLAADPAGTDTFFTISL